MKHCKLLLLFGFFIFYGFSSVDKDPVIENISIFYLGFEYYEYPGGDLNNLKFEIKNNSLDTVYISHKNISFKIKKAKLLLKDNYIYSAGSPFYWPIIRKRFPCNEAIKYEEYLTNLKYKFANALYAKNSLDEKHLGCRDFIIRTIANDCIILMPNEAVDYECSFYNKKLDRSCIVEAKYLTKKAFTHFIDDNGKKIAVNY